MNAKTLSAIKLALLGLAAFCFCVAFVVQGCSRAATTMITSVETEPITESFSELDWPGTSELAKRLPAPESKWGEVQMESSAQYGVYIGNTSKAQYDKYVAACLEKGFNADYKKGQELFTGEDAEGYEVSVQYHSDESYMSIYINAPEGADAAASTSSSASAASEPSTANSVTPSFKEAMDSYEAFFDEYCAFMEKYADSDDSVSMMADYAKFAARYSETMDKLDAIDEDALSPADYAYYIEVMGRINQKLMNVAG